MNKKIAVVNLITKTALLKKKAPKVISNNDAMIVKFSKELQNHEIDIDLYISDSYKPNEHEDVGVNIIYLKTLLKSIFWPSCIPFTPKLISHLRNKYDVIICSELFQWSTVFTILSKAFTHKKKPKIIIWQEMAKHQRMLKKIPSKFFHKFILPFFDKYIDLYIPRGKLAKKFLLAQKVNSNKINEPISHGYDQNIFYYDKNIKKDNYIFSPSRLAHCKGIDILLKAFAIFSKENPDIKLIIQGSGPMYGECKSLAENLNISQKVDFHTNTATHIQIKELYAKALLTVIASRSDLEIFSSMESIACGTPVIISNGADSHMNYIDNKAGIVFETENYKQLATILLETVSNSKLTNKIQKNAIEQAYFYTNKNIVKQFSHIIGRISE